MNKNQYSHVLFRVILFLELFFLFSFNPVAYSNRDQSQDTLKRIARFNHTENDSDYYYVRLSLFHSEFERLSFYKKAYDRGIYIADKHNFHNDSTLFRTTFDKEQALLEFQYLYQIAEEANLSTAETVKKKIVASSPFYSSTASQQSELLNAPSGGAMVCSDAEVSCSENTYKFSSGTTGTAEPPVGGYPDYGCLSSQPCPAWFYMQVSVAGDIIIFIEQVGMPPPFPPPPLDVDFICWGPFTSLTDGCGTGLTGANIVDCSYSPNATETCSIMNAQAGEIYILLITNFSQDPGTITFSQTGGSGVTDCNIVVSCSMIAITANPTICDELTNTFSVSGNIEFSNPSPTGTLTITDSTAVPLISQTFSPPFNSPLPYTLTNIPCDGATHFLTAIFSDSLTCNLTQPVLSPPTVCPHAMISGGGVICDDGISETTVNIDINGSPGPYSFTYAINGISQTPVINYSGPMPYPISTKIPGLYTLVSVSNLVCPVGGIVSGSANVILNPLPVPSFITGENSVCLNIPGKIYMTEAGKSDYIWTIPPQATITAGGSATDNSVTLTWNTTGSYVISVNYSDPVTHCTASNATPFGVTVNSLPAPSFIAGENSVCLNIPGKIYTTEPGKLNYIWTIPPQATITAGGTGADNGVTLTWNTVGSYSISVNYTNPVTLCTATDATPFSVTVKPLPVPTFTSGVNSVCLNIPGNVYMTEAGKLNYIWTIPPEATITAGGSVNDNSVTLTWNTIGNYSISVNYTDPITQCTASTSVPFAVTVKLLPVPVIAGPAIACVNTPGPKYYTEPGMSGYTWNVNGGTFTSGITPDTINVTWTSTGLKNLTVNYTAPNGCIAANPTVFYVDVSTLPVPSITTGPDNICIDIQTSYSTQQGMTGYVWTVSPDGSFTGGDTYKIDVTWNTPGLKQISVNYQMGPGCTGATPATKSVLVNQPTPPAITSPENPICMNNGTSYTTQPGMSDYLWSISPGGTFTSLIDGNIVNVTWNAPGPRYVEVNFTNPVGCTAPVPFRYDVQVNPLPVTTITAGTGPDCELQQHVYQTPPDPGCTFTWSANPGEVAAGQGTNLAEINWLATGPALVSVTGTYVSTTGCTSSSTYSTTVYPSPVPSFTACFDLVTTKNAKSFILKGGIPLLGQYQGSPGISYDVSTGNYWFNPSSAAEGVHQITYYSQNSYGCSKTSSPVSISVLPSNATFPCGTDFTDPRDNRQYPTIQIVSQCWISANLDYGQPVSALLTQRDNCTVEKYCYDDISGNCASYGGLYQWDELMKYDNTPASQGYCPPGWHIPTETEWNTLFGFFISNGFAGSPLKYDGFSGFNAFLYGVNFKNSSSSFNGFATLFWSSTSSGPYKAWAHGMNTSNPSVSYYPSARSNAFSVRCLKD